MIIPDVKYQLKNKQTETSIINMISYFNSDRFKMSTGEKVLVSTWDTNNQKVTRKNPEALEINHRLGLLKDKFRSLYRKELTEGRLPTVNSMKRLMNTELDPSLRYQSNSLLHFIKAFIKDVEDIKSIQTIKSYNNTLNLIRNFEEETRSLIYFDSVNVDFYNRFVHYLSDKGYAKNSIGKHIKNLKLFLNESLERELHNNLAFKSSRFKVLREDTEAIYLSESELEKMYHLDLSRDFGLEKARDLFLVGAYTGLRFSDYNRLDKENIIEINAEKYIKIRTQKTDELVIIPIREEVMTILKKYNGNLPSMSNQVLNRNIKKVGEYAEIYDDVRTSITKGGKKEHESKLKWELIMSHTARRSFATNCYLSGVPSISIMKITGHRTERAFMKYLKFDQETNAKNLMEYDFFKRNKD